MKIKKEIPPCMERINIYWILDLWWPKMAEKDLSVKLGVRP